MQLLHDYTTRIAIRDILHEHGLAWAASEQAALKASANRKAQAPLPAPFPLTLEQLFGYISRALVSWASAEVAATATAASSAASAAAVIGPEKLQRLLPDTQAAPSHSSNKSSSGVASTSVPVDPASARPGVTLLGSEICKKHLLVPCMVKLPSESDPLSFNSFCFSSGRHGPAYAPCTASSCANEFNHPQFCSPSPPLTTEHGTHAHKPTAVANSEKGKKSPTAAPPNAFTISENTAAASKPQQSAKRGSRK